MKDTIYCTDIECESCVKILTRLFNKLQGVNSFDITKTKIDIDYDESLIKIDNIMSSIRDKGYKASNQPIRKKRVRDRAKEFLKDREKYKIEYSMLKTISFSLLLLFGLTGALLYWQQLSTPSILHNYGWWTFYAGISIASLAGATWHFKIYKAEYTCMVGMMVGMTLGMQSGMMVGYIIGATNGFFVGALSGMLIGCALGAYTGRCCGIMGVMEGVMAGIMGGTMGPMISVMMFNENILWFTPPYMLLNIFILIGMAFMIFEEVVEDNESARVEPLHHTKFLIACILAWAMISGIMFLTPPSIFLQ